MSFRYSDLLVDVWAGGACPDPSRPPCPSPSKCAQNTQAQCPAPSKAGRVMASGESLPALRHQLRQSLGQPTA